jgi:hypothetical protein
MVSKASRVSAPKPRRWIVWRDWIGKDFIAVLSRHPGGCWHYERIRSAFFFCRAMTEEAVRFTASEIKNSTIPRKNKT